MRYIDTRSLSSISNTLEKYHHSKDKTGNHLIHGVGLTSLLVYGRKRKQLTKAQRKRIANKRRSKFVAEIIVRHQELHDNNRKRTLELAKTRILNGSLRKPKSRSVIEMQREERLRSSNRKDSLLIAKDRIYARRLRSRSRWNELIESKKED